MTAPHIPGDPDSVDALARTLADFARGMGEGAGKLGSIKSGEWHGKGGNAFRAIIGDQPATQMLVEGELHGFGLPTSRLDTSVEFRATPVPTLSYRIEQRGWITDLDASATIRLPPRQLKRIVVRLGHGNIRVTDATRSHVVENRTLQLDLQTKAGVTLLRKSQ